MNSRIFAFVAFVGLSMLSGAAFAHPGHDGVSSFVAGFAHPFTGLDHLLAMVALGIWAAQRKGASMLLAPAVFTLSMLLGALVALNGASLPFVEHGIALSILLIGVLVAAVPPRGLSLALILPLIGVGAAMHGYAHGIELPGANSAMPFVAGFTAATLALHGVGIFIGRVLGSDIRVRRAMGMGIALAGSVLAVSVS
jgi:urease accessory protein